MAGQIKRMTWRPYGPHLTSYEGDDGYLGVEYADKVDTRWGNEVWLAPALNIIDCGAAGGTAADSNDMALSDNMAANMYAYISRGTKWAKIRVSNHTLTSDGTEAAVAEATTSVFKTQSAAGTQEISFGMNSTAYRVITTVSTGATDTDSDNDAGKICPHFFLAHPSDVVAALGRSGNSSTPQNTIYSIELTGSVDMDTNTLTTKATLADNVTFTGGCLDGTFWIPMTDRGPYFLDGDFLTFRPLLPFLDRNPANGRHAFEWQFLGVVYPTYQGLRYMKNIYEGASIGPEVFRRNNSPIRGTPDGLHADGRWLYATIYNTATGQTFFCAARPRQEGDPHYEILSWFSLFEVKTAGAAAARSRFVQAIGTANDTLTNPEIWYGNADDVGYFAAGRTDRWVDDANYTFSTSGTLTLTESRRWSHWDKRILGFEVETANCTADRTVSVAVSVDGGTAVTLATITTNGRRWVQVPPDYMEVGNTVQPTITLATDSSSSSPRLVGDMDIIVELVDREVDGNKHWWPEEEM